MRLISLILCSNEVKVLTRATASEKHMSVSAQEVRKSHVCSDNEQAFLEKGDFNGNILQEFRPLEESVDHGMAVAHCRGEFHHLDDDLHVGELWNCCVQN